MTCDNIKCPYYRKPMKREWWEVQVGVKDKKGGCKYNFCKQGNKRRK